MSLRDLTNGEMISVTTPMVDRKSDVRKAIDSDPLTKAVAAKVDEAHSAMELLLRPSSSAEVAAIRDKLVDLDFRHDSLARGYNGFFDGLIAFSSDPARIEELTSLKSFLIGDGLAFITRSYLDEAGRLQNLKSTMSDKHVGLLKQIRADDKTLYERFVEWCDIGEQMRKLDLQRAALESASDSLPSRADSIAARNQWISSVNALQAMADLAQLPPETMASIFGQLDSLLARAARRGKTPKTETPTPPPQPAAPDPTK